MTKGELYQVQDSVMKILAVEGQEVLVIDCTGTKMPKWMEIGELNDAALVGTESLPATRKESDLSDVELAVARKRYTMIAGVLPYIFDDGMRNQLLSRYAEYYQVSRRTITRYLCKYLVYEDIGALSDQPKMQKEKPLTQDQKNMRRAINKYYYSRRKNPLTYAFLQMLKERYCDDDGNLLLVHPTLSQFRYFFQKTRKKQTEIISREGIKEYQLNYRPLLGEGVQEMAPAVGWGMLDGTICDIYLVDDSGNLVGRPVLLANVDAYSGLCNGYSLLWEGGVYSIRELILNTITDKVDWCRKFGIDITEEQWPCHGTLPGIFICDRGSEYISYNFEQITELGCQVVSLSSFSANMKGPVEKLFDLVQESYKPYCKGKGVIEPDFQKRGTQDYRKDACLTIKQFEKIVIQCIIYHNSQRIIENFPYTEEMLNAEIKPYANTLWQYGRTLPGANLIPTTKEQVVLTLLPRTNGRFTRRGLMANGLRYSAEGFTEEYLKGGEVSVAFNPDDAGYIYLIRDGYIRFRLIERRYANKSIDEAQIMKTKQNHLNASCQEQTLQAKIDLARYIETITGQSEYRDNVKLKNIRSTRQKERAARHRDLMQEVITDDN